jgi:hypothetical protein
VLEILRFRVCHYTPTRVIGRVKADGGASTLTKFVKKVMLRMRVKVFD